MSVAELTQPIRKKSSQDPAPRVWSVNEREILNRLGIDGSRMTRHQYYQLFDENLFIDQKVMLLDGVVFQERPMKAPHATGISRACFVLEPIFKLGKYIRVQMPIDLDLFTEPHPDLAVVTGNYLDYAEEHPTTALLIVEVSETTIATDLGEKAFLYAAGRIADYWVIDLNEPKLIVFRDPVQDPAAPHGARFQTRLELGHDDFVTPHAAPKDSIKVSDLLP